MQKETKTIKFKLKWPAKTSKKEEPMISSIEIPLYPKSDKDSNYLKIQPFIDPEGWWRIENIRGKHLLGLSVKVQGKNYRWWPSIDDLHKILFGFIYVTTKNDQPKDYLIIPKKRIMEDDLRGVRSLLKNILFYIESIYGNRYLDDFLLKREEQ